MRKGENTMRLPINATNIIELYEKEKGTSVKESIKKLIETSVVFINSCYDFAKSNETVACPLDKNEFVQIAQKIYEKRGDVFTDPHRKFFELAIDIVVEAYQQGLAETQQKARIC